MTSHDTGNLTDKRAPGKGEGTARYALRRELGVWRVTFEGSEAMVRDGTGMRRAAFLMLHSPGVALHATDLLLRIDNLERGAGARRGEGASVSKITVQQRCLALEDAETRRAVYRRMRELETTAEDEDLPGAAREEARREADILREGLLSGLGRSRDEALRATDRVGKSLRRLAGALVAARDEFGRPHPVLAAFGAHLKRHLIGASREGARNGAASCFLYAPPEGVVWEAA